MGKGSVTKCKGCQMAFDPKSVFLIDEYVHEDWCVFGSPKQQEKALRELVTEIIIADIKAHGPISEVLKQCA